MILSEFIVENAALTWFEELGYTVWHGPHLALNEPASDRDAFGVVVLVGRLRKAIRRLNPALKDKWERIQTGGYETITLADVESWVRGGESETLELKRTTGERREADRKICAMLNHQDRRVISAVEPNTVTDVQPVEVSAKIGFRGLQ